MRCNFAYTSREDMDKSKMIRRESMSEEEKLDFWYQWLNVGEIIPYGMDEEFFFAECERFKEYLLLNDRLFQQYYTVHYNHLEFVPYVI